jgi:hypothetical protein
MSSRQHTATAPNRADTERAATPAPRAAGFAQPAQARDVPGAIAGLQRGAGNHATAALIQRLGTASAGGVLRRCGGKTCPPGTCDHDGELRRNSTAPGPATAPPLVHQVLGAAGERLHPAARSYLEPRFGHDFSTIQVHTDATAAASAEAVGARAYTVGNHLAFAAGAYAPHTEQGRRLIAHELAHTLQQGATTGAAGTTAQAKLIVGEPDHPLEREADHVAERVMRGSSAPELTSAAGPVLASTPSTVLRQGGTQPARTDPVEAAPAAAPRLSTSGPLVQRQTEPGVHSPGSRGSSGVQSEKWREDVERSYRRAGLVEAANAVAGCREWGACDRLLTQSEAWDAYRTGRVKGKLGDPPEKSRPTGMTANVAVAGVVAPVAVGGSAQAAAAKTALERAAVRWGTSGLVPAAEAEVGGAAATGGAAAGTVAVPIAVGVILVLAIADLVGYTSFQIALQRQGYFILPDPLGVCIGSCHQPAAPTFRPDPRFLEPQPRPFTQQFDPKDWYKSAPKLGPTLGPIPKPESKPREDEEQRRRCRLVERAVGRGDDPLADLFCSTVVPFGQSYDIYSPVGVAEIDALLGRTWYECKCGYLSLLDALERGDFWARMALDRFDGQIRRQNRIAGYCGYQYRLVVSNRRVEEFLRARHADITILRVEWDPCS